MERISKRAADRNAKNDMIFIAHRGNMFGPNPTAENNPGYVKNALKNGFDVEVDVWRIDGKYFLGHDKPVYQVEDEFLKNDKIWCHAKNVIALFVVHPKINMFWHDIDMYTLTSRGDIWGFPRITDNSPCDFIAIRANLRFTGDGKADIKQYRKYRGICSDYIVDVKKHLS